MLPATRSYAKLVVGPPPGGFDPANCTVCKRCPRRARRTASVLLPASLLAGAVLLAGVLALLFAARAGAQPAGGPVMVFEQALQAAGDQELRWPVAVASGAAGEVAVADVHGARLLLWRHGADGWGVVRAANLPAPPAGVAWDGGRYVVALRGEGGLMAAEGDELALRPLPLPDGGVPGPLAGDPRGGVLVFDHAHGRVLRLDGGGRVTSQAAVEGYVTALAAGPGDGFFTAVAEDGAVRRHAAGGAVEETWRLPAAAPVPAWPSGLAVEAGGDVLVADRHTGRILVLEVDGEPAGFGARQGWEPGLLRFPAGLALMPDGRVAVADLGNGRVQIFRRVGSGS
jgi:hypothetical protein